MLTASQSEPSALAGRKRKAQDLGAETIYVYILERLFSAIKNDDWEQLTSKFLGDPQLPPVIST
jgi:hypothetical protein